MNLTYALFFDLYYFFRRYEKIAPTKKLLKEAKKIYNTDNSYNMIFFYVKDEREDVGTDSELRKKLRYPDYTLNPHYRVEQELLQRDENFNIQKNYMKANLNSGYYAPELPSVGVYVEIEGYIEQFRPTETLSESLQSVISLVQSEVTLPSSLLEYMDNFGFWIVAAIDKLESKVRCRTSQLSLLEQGYHCCFLPHFFPNTKKKLKKRNFGMTWEGIF